MKRIVTLAAAVVAAAGAACGGIAAGGAGQRASGAVEMLLDADRAFNRAVAEHERGAFLALIAPDAIFGGGTPNELHGRDAIAAAWAPFLAAAGPRLTWTPTNGEILGGGDLGYTVGTYERRSANGSVGRGNYLTVWRKPKDGSWQAVYDTGSAFTGP
jgi:ketosteroid isomerase-like protein